MTENPPSVKMRSLHETLSCFALSSIDFFIQVLHICSNMPESIVSEKSNTLLNLKIEDISRAGAGVARYAFEDGLKVVFVPYTMPGDVVLARVVSQKKRYLEAELVEILESSPDRVAPKCAVFQKCGGCAWQHIPYIRQWKIKSEGVKHALARTQAEIPEGVSLEEFPAVNPWGYRNRIQLHGQKNEGKTEIGFFARGSRQLVATDRCEIAREEINQNFSRIIQEAENISAPFKVEAEIKKEVHLSWNKKHAALGFRQVNDEQNAVLKKWVDENLSDGATVFDLYGGSGNLTLDSFFRFARVDCVDLGSPLGIENQPLNYKFFKTDVVKWLDRRANEVQKNNTNQLENLEIVLDPPREGLMEFSNKIIHSLDVLGAKKIIAIGCDADSWARDLTRFQKSGWKLKKIAVFDLFPQTPHVESGAVLIKS